MTSIGNLEFCSTECGFNEFFVPIYSGRKRHELVSKSLNVDNISL